MATRRGISGGSAESPAGAAPPEAWARRGGAAPPQARRPTSNRLTAERAVTDMVVQVEPTAHGQSSPCVSGRVRGGPSIPGDSSADAPAGTAHALEALLSRTRP